MSKDAEEIRLCKLFLLDPSHHPDNPSKPMKRGMGPYKKWIETCEKHKDVLKLGNLNLEQKPISRSPQKTISRSPQKIDVRSPQKTIARSPQRTLTRSPKLIAPRSPQNLESYKRNRMINTEELNENLSTKGRLRSMNYKLPLLSLIHLTVDDFDEIKNYDYDLFIDEVIKRTNNNGGNITKYYMNQIAGYDIVVEIPKKYTTKQTGNNMLKFHDDKGITNGRLLYNLASYIKSNYPENYYYFTGLKEEHGNINKLILGFESW